MVKFHIKLDSEIPASKQLFDQIQFAIASRQYPPGHRLPSTRQLAMMTGLHRNTISKVYRQLEDTGLVESLAGSGIYVKAQGHEGGTKYTAHKQSTDSEDIPEIAYQVVQNGINELLSLGCSLQQVREIFLSEINWRLQCSAQVLVTVPQSDIGAGKLMLQDLEPALGLPIQLVPMEQLVDILEETDSATVVTSRYFIKDVNAIASPKSVRVIPVDIYNYAREIKLINELKENSCLGIVSLSSGFLDAAERIIHSLRGEEILVMTAQASDVQKLKVLIRTAQTIICDQGSYGQVKEIVDQISEDLIRFPEIICSDNYISAESIRLLRQELGLGQSSSAREAEN
ncbi:MAG: GntR family transcriptional regulator [Cyanobacteria bacterium SW_9_44_58]|nr:MAG: GntR family transcriptional regulator [Cyanobacteria bacterium SW_9_44_58]